LFQVFLKKQNGSKNIKDGSFNYKIK